VSHQRADRVERDGFVEQVFAVAGLPLVRFPAQRGYALAEVAGRMSVVFGDGAHGERPPTGEPAVSSGQCAAGNVGPETSNSSPPLCPKCGIALVIRSGPRGSFYGCSNFPKCRVTAPVCI
jgi:hypothetical protein